MYYLNQTKKFLSFTVTNAGGFSSYGGGASSGHFYYKNDIADPWGNDGVHIGSFDLKTAGSTTFVIGDSGALTGTLSNSVISNKQKYTSMCNLFSAGTLDYHFLTIVVDRIKPADYVPSSCPCTQSPGQGILGNKTVCSASNFNFLNGYGHGGASLTITPYYINSSNNLIGGSNLSTSFWDLKEFAVNVNCYNLSANSPISGRYPDSASTYGGNLWTAGSTVMPQHACDANGPSSSLYAGAFRYYFFGASAFPSSCVSTMGDYTNKNGNHYWGRGFSNPLGAPKIKITQSNGPYGPALSENYYNDTIVYDSLYGSSQGVGGTGLVQCPIATGITANLARPRYLLDISPRCNAGARTNSQGRYYNGSTFPTYGGYGFYMRFNWDALCYPCA